MSKIEKIAIFGGTGMTGSCALDEAVRKGLKVKLLLRNPALLPSELKDKVEIVEGNVVNAEDVEKTVEGVDGVTVVLGTRNNLEPTTELSRGLSNIIDSMKKHNVKAISVCLSSFLFYEIERVPQQFHELNAEHGRMLKILEASGLNYVAVLPPHIADNPRGEYLVDHDALPGGRTVSKRDLGAFLVECLSQERHYGHKVGISSKINQR